MLKYFYYIWNLLKNNERLELFRHFGNCIMSAILFTIIDWQYLILLWVISSYGYENILQIIVGLQLFSWMMSFWYYYIKFKILSKQGYFYKLISSRHYKYILTRISQNAPFSWIQNKSTNELTAQLMTTDKGLQYILSFMTSIVRMTSIITLSIFVIGWNYKTSIVMFGIFFLILYTIITKQILSSDYNAKKNKYKEINKQNSLIISNNISVLLDSILHGDEQKIIQNIAVFNTTAKNQQNELFKYEDQTYTRIGLLLMTGYIMVLVSTSYFMNLTINDFMVFFIAALLTYKCVSSNINELCDMYVNIRQTHLDFESLDDIWKVTKNKRKSVKQIKLPTKNANINEFKGYHEYIFNKKEKENLLKLENLIKTNHKEEYYNYCNKNKKSSRQIITDKDYLKFNTYKRFFISKGLYTDEIDYKTLYSSYKNKINKNKSLFSLNIYHIEFKYPYIDGDKIGGLSYSSDIPITLKSNEHVLIEGVSGSGKTTFMKILRGVIDLETGKGNSQAYVTIKFNGHSERVLNMSNISNSICYCKQNSTAFTSGNIYQIITDDYITKNTKNIDDKTRNNILLSLEVACIDDKFKNLRYKCSRNTISGGQIQRLTVAKNIYRILQSNKQIIILDEIDAGLDYKTAEKLLLNLDLLFKDKMMLIVLHTEQLKTLFENKIVIDNGIIR